MLPVVVWFHDTSFHAGSQRVIKTNTLLLWGQRLGLLFPPESFHSLDCLKPHMSA